MSIKNVPSYQGRRDDVLNLLIRPDRVLDVGCNVGTLGAAVKQKF